MKLVKDTTLQYLLLESSAYYDVYLLATSLTGLETIPNSGVGYDALLTTGAYGGEMIKQLF